MIKLFYPVLVCREPTGSFSQLVHTCSMGPKKCEEACKRVWAEWASEWMGRHLWTQYPALLNTSLSSCLCTSGHGPPMNCPSLLLTISKLSSSLSAETGSCSCLKRSVCKAGIGILQRYTYSILILKQADWSNSCLEACSKQRRKRKTEQKLYKCRRPGV